MATNGTYIPGVCNIGPAEIRLRRWTGHIGLAATVFLFASYFIAPIGPTFRLLIFFPAAVSAIGYLQAWMHFCAQFGFVGLFNVSTTFGKRESINQQDFRRKDLQKALTIVGLSFLVGTAVSFIAYIFPF